MATLFPLSGAPAKVYARRLTVCGLGLLMLANAVMPHPADATGGIDVNRILSGRASLFQSFLLSSNPIKIINLLFADQNSIPVPKDASSTKGKDAGCPASTSICVPGFEKNIVLRAGGIERGCMTAALQACRGWQHAAETVTCGIYCVWRSVSPPPVACFFLLPRSSIADPDVTCLRGSVPNL